MHPIHAIRCGLRIWPAALWLLFSASVEAVQPTVRGTMDAILQRMVASLSPEELLRVDPTVVRRFISAEDWGVLATQYWHFEANIPVVVSVMRDVKQAEVPFWLGPAGFRKTDLKVANGNYEYEVWQKSFDKGPVALGINGFSQHRPHYFVCVGSERPGAKLEIARVFPSDQQVIEMREGAWIYHDWPDLVLTKVPDALKGQTLLPTYRGRAREAQLVEAFRKTAFPSSAKPDQLVLTWSESPLTTQTIQWRTAPLLADGKVRYQEKGASAGTAWKEEKADRQTIEDRFLVNDPRVNHFTATLRGLKPGTTYVYSVGGAMEDSRSEPSEFTTAPGKDEPFTFVFLSDTHNSPACGKLLARALESHPDTAFCTISGDLVGRGYHRDDWDQLFDQTRDFARRRPLVPSIGNHDALDGLGAGLYLSFFGLPTNGAPRLPPEQSYSMEYGNALFLVLDATASVEDQRPWLEGQLARARATWKFAIFHFPPYGPGQDYPDIIREWCSVFDQYHVDFVLSGHVHDYVRTHPIKNGKRVASPAEGTVYLVTVAVASRPGEMSRPDHAAVAEHAGLPLYQVFTINGKRLVTQSCDVEGRVRDEFAVEK
jgi:acid phosphatase type 7